jgi:hypothetical protein
MLGVAVTQEAGFGRGGFWRTGASTGERKSQAAKQFNNNSRASGNQ